MEAEKKSIFMLNNCLIKVIGESSLGFCFSLFTICPIYTELKTTKAPAYEILVFIAKRTAKAQMSLRIK